MCIAALLAPTNSVSPLFANVFAWNVPRWRSVPLVQSLVLTAPVKREES